MQYPKIHHFLRPILKASLCVLLTFGLSACISTFEPTIKQGNEVSNDSISLLQFGMSKPEVRTILGSPLTTNIFNDDRWEYYYSKTKLTSKESKSTIFTLFFKDERLADIKGAISMDTVEKLRANPEEQETGGTIITKPTQKEKGIFSGLFKNK